MCMAWRFHFPIRNYDFKPNSPLLSNASHCNVGMALDSVNMMSRPTVNYKYFLFTTCTFKCFIMLYKLLQNVEYTNELSRMREYG